MYQAVLIARILGMLMALFFAMSVLLAISGVSYSQQPPPLFERAVSAAPAALLSVLLLLPQRLFLCGRRYKVLLVCYGIACIALGCRLILEVSRYHPREVHWLIFPVLAALLLVVLFNGFALWAQHRAMPPNKSFKPNPLRGSA